MKLKFLKEKADKKFPYIQEVIKLMEEHGGDSGYIMLDGKMDIGEKQIFRDCGFVISEATDPDTSISRTMIEF